MHAGHLSGRYCCCSIKSVQDYAFLQPGTGFSVRLVGGSSILTMIHLNVEQLRERFYPQRPAQRADERLRVCLAATLAAIRMRKRRCLRCRAAIPLATVTQKTEHTEVPAALLACLLSFAAGKTCCSSR